MPPGIKMEIESRDLTKNTAVHNNVTIVLAICICVIVVRLLDGYHREESAYRSNYLAPPRLRRLSNCNHNLRSPVT